MNRCSFGKAADTLITRTNAVSADDIMRILCREFHTLGRFIDAIYMPNM